MKLITAVIKPFKLDDVKAALEVLGVQGLDRERGAGLRSAERPHRGLPRRRVHRRPRAEGAGRRPGRRRAMPTRSSTPSSRQREPARSATARCGSPTSTRWSGSGPVSVTLTPSDRPRAIAADGLAHSPGWRSTPARTCRCAPARALTDAYDALAARAELPADLLGAGSRWSPSAASAGASRRRTPTSTCVLLHDGKAEQSRTSPTRSGTRSGTAASASTTRCARRTRRCAWRRTTSRRCSGCSTSATSPAMRACPGRCASGVLDLWRATAPKRVAELRETVSRALGDRRRGGVPARAQPQGLARRPARRADPARARGGPARRLSGRGARGVRHVARHPRRAAATARASRRRAAPAGAAGRWRRTFGVTERRRVTARRVNDAARTIALALDIAWRRVETAAGPSAHCRHAGCCREDSARPRPIGHRWPRTSSRRTARSCSPATPTRGPTRCWCCAPPGWRPSTTCRSPPFALERLATESSPLPPPWPAEALDDFVALLGTGRRGGARARVARPGRAARSADPGVGRRPVPRPAQPGAPLHRRPAPAGDRRPGRGSGPPSVATGPAADRRAAARHRQGIPRRRPLGGRRRHARRRSRTGWVCRTATPRP